MVALVDAEVVAVVDAEVVTEEVCVVEGVVSLQSVKLPCRYALIAVSRCAIVASQPVPEKSVFRLPPISHDVVPANVSGKLILLEMVFRVVATSVQAVLSLLTSTVNTSYPPTSVHCTGLLLCELEQVSRMVFNRSAWS